MTLNEASKFDASFEFGKMLEKDSDTSMERSGLVSSGLVFLISDLKGN